MTARLVQVTNVSTSVTKEQLKSLFTHLGRIEDIQLYPESEIVAQSYNAKVGYIRFASGDTAQAALNLTNTSSHSLLACSISASFLFLVVVVLSIVSHTRRKRSHPLLPPSQSEHITDR